MRQTLNGWLWFVLGGCLFLWPSFSFAHIDQDGARDAGSANVQQRECMSWAMFAGRVMTLKHKGIPSQHVLSVMFGVAEVPETAHNRIVAIVAEGYVWPSGDEEYQTWTFGQCMKGWPQTPESSSDAGALFRRAASSQKIICENIAAAAEQMERNFRTTEIRPEHYVNHGELARTVDRCMKDNAPVAQCVMRRCMGVNASNDVGRERFRQAVRWSLQRARVEFERAHASSIR